MTRERSIFITGAAAGIGAETARLFVRNGWRVGASDVDTAALGALRDELGTDGVSVHVADVRDRAAVAAALRDFTAPTGGRLDALFANAGVLFMGPDEALTAAQKDLLVDVNVKGVIHAIDAGFPYLKRTPGAHVVAMASTSAEYGSPQHAVYSATKFFVRGLTEALNVGDLRRLRADRHGVRRRGEAGLDRAPRREDHAAARGRDRLEGGARRSRALARRVRCPDDQPGRAPARLRDRSGLPPDHASLNTAAGNVLGTATGAAGASSRRAMSVPPHTQPVSSASTPSPSW